MRTIAVYGSLKKGCYNHKRFGLGEPMAHAEVSGSMYVNPHQGYPRLFKPGIKTGGARDKAYPVEIYEVSDNLYRTLDMMEQGSAYTPTVVAFDVEGRGLVEATVWFCDDDYPVTDGQFVESYGGA